MAKVVQVRLKETDFESWSKSSKSAGLTLSEWVRKMVEAGCIGERLRFLQSGEVSRVLERNSEGVVTIREMTEADEKSFDDWVPFMDDYEECARQADAVEAGSGTGDESCMAEHVPLLVRGVERGGGDLSPLADPVPPAPVKSKSKDKRCGRCVKKGSRWCDECREAVQRGMKSAAKTYRGKK